MAIVKPKKKKMGDRMTDIIFGIIIALIIIVCLYPFWHVIMYSFSESKAAMSGGVFLLPRQFTTITYEMLFQTKKIFIAFGNSVAKTVVGTAISMVVTILTAYPLAQDELKAKRPILFIIYFTMLFSGGIIPTYILIKDLNMLDTFWVYVIPVALNPYNMFVLRSFFMSIPKSLTEAARLDGANPLQVLYMVTLPLSKASLATITLYYVQAFWNSYMDGVLYVNSSSLELLQVYLRRLIAQSGASAALGEMGNLSAASTVTEESMKMTVIAFSIIPVIIVYLCLQKYFVKGAMVGAVKE